MPSRPNLTPPRADPVPTVPAKRSRRKEARPGELLAAALDLFVEKGFAATRAEEVAHRAGVSKGTLFLYFQFVDMGVGRGQGAGVKKGDAGYDKIRNSLGQLRRHQRRPKPWYSKEIGYQSHRLAELISEATGEILIANLRDALPAAPLTLTL